MFARLIDVVARAIGIRKDVDTILKPITSIASQLEALGDQEFSAAERKAARARKLNAECQGHDENGRRALDHARKVAALVG